ALTGCSFHACSESCCALHLLRRGCASAPHVRHCTLRCGSRRSLHLELLTTLSEHALTDRLAPLPRPRNHPFASPTPRPPPTPRRPRTARIGESCSSRQSWPQARSAGRGYPSCLPDPSRTLDPAGQSLSSTSQSARPRPSG